MKNTIFNGQQDIKPKFIGPRRLKETTKREINYKLGLSPVKTQIELTKKAINSKI